jgi:hypothetical protein
MTAKKFNIGDLVAYDQRVKSAQVWGIIIEFDEWTPNSKTAKVRWSNGWTDWYNITHLIMIEKAKR